MDLYNYTIKLLYYTMLMTYNTFMTYNFKRNVFVRTKT